MIINFYKLKCVFAIACLICIPQCYAESLSVNDVYLKMVVNLIKDSDCGNEQYILQRPDELGGADGEAYMTNANDITEADLYADGRGVGSFKWLSLVAGFNVSVGKGFPSGYDKQFLCLARAYQTAVGETNPHLKKVDESNYKKALENGRSSFSSSKYKSTFIMTKKTDGDFRTVEFKMEPLS